MMVHAFNLSLWEVEREVSLVCIATFSTATAMERDFFSNQNKIGARGLGVVVHSFNHWEVEVGGPLSPRPA